ncbi:MULTISPECIES: vWA domain-containing protein [Flavobacterium]|uniref:vWA domain-containing protein n=1 Tax=Flavobacterium TaxID=237 RepID=UPI001FCC6CB3|nr:MULTISPECIES: BatA and WFA domain-containing protein [Flavobacterium]UOK41337.1 BatA and WFA domain-containing protein [Flavobacterium enshiense]
MQFKHPEILYFLFLLVIPILVHLFQLRRFKTEYFTNVRFLKELSIQTRKSSKIKKWLLLATRLLLLACLIIAFAQPFFKAKDSQHSGNEMIIILDNSFSMQAKGSRGELLKRSIQELLEDTPGDQRFSLVTNTETFWDTDIKSIQKDLQNLQYSSTPFQLDFLLTKIETKKHNVPKDIFVITDAVNVQSKNLEKLSENSPVYYWIPSAEHKNNASIDGVSISGQSETFYEIKVDVKGFGELEKDIPMSVYNGKNLVAKTVVKLEDNKKSVQFNLPKKDFHGYVAIEDNSLNYDNSYYFSISKPEKSNVIVIGESQKNNFLSRIYTPDEFNLITTELNGLDYNAIEKQDIIILNEIKDIPQALTTTLKAFYEKGGNVVLIPSAESTTQNLNAFLGNFSGIQFGSLQNQEKQITKIAFTHPLYQTVFEKRTDNFQYPKVNAAFSVNSKASPVLSYADQSFFLGSATNKIGNLYVFSAPINKTNSNFRNSPLIVPTFFNMGQNDQKTGISAFTIGENQNLVLDALLSKDEVVTIANDNSDFIPMQQILNNKIKLTFGDYPEQSGNFSVMKGKDVMKKISFNHPRTESNLSLTNDNIFDNFTSVTSVEAVFNDIHSARTGNEVWNYFILATLLFLVLELLIQKFVK